MEHAEQGSVVITARDQRVPMANVRIRDAAVRLFAGKGFQATGIREIATEAGVTSAALYHYVGAKEDLLVEIMKGVMEPLISGAQRIVAEHETPEGKLGALVEHHVSFHAMHQMATLITDTELRSLSAANREQVVQRRDAYEQIWRATIAEGIADRTFKVDDGWLTTIALLQMCTGVAHWYRASGPLTLNRLARRYVDLALSLLRATRDGMPMRADMLERRTISNGR